MWLAIAIRRTQEAIMSGGILAIAALTIVNVITRSLLGISLASAEELSQFCIVAVTFVGVGYAASEGRHIRMTALYDQLGERARKLLMIAICAGTAALMFTLAWFSVQYVGTVHALGTVSPALEVSLYIIYLAAPLGLAFAGLQYTLAVIRNLRSPGIWVSFRHPESREAPPEDGI